MQHEILSDHSLRSKAGRTIGLLLIVGASSCITPLDMSVPPVEYQLVVDGLITNDPGPYTVRLYRVRPLKRDIDRFVVERDATVRIFDSDGTTEELVEVEEGVYQTAKNGIRGKVGHSYHIEIQTLRGGDFYTEPDEIRPVGTVDSIWWEYAAGSLEDGIKQQGFKIYGNASGIDEHIDLLRFRRVGTYMVRTYPERHKRTVGGGGKAADPLPCSGYELNDGVPRKVRECTCCYCWVTEQDELPVLFNENYNGLDYFNNLYMGYVPITPFSFSFRYHIEIQQLSITGFTHRFWSMVRSQTAGTTDLFQPAIGSLVGNVKSRDGSKNPVGIFWAAGISRKSMFIEREDVPEEQSIGHPFEYETDCGFLEYSTRLKPSFWP
jgi:hypothetical protein